MSKMSNESFLGREWVPEGYRKTCHRNKMKYNLKFVSVNYSCGVKKVQEFGY